jgi:phosphoribosylaminoimidazole-succinocarboxamide synthase
MLVWAITFAKILGMHFQGETALYKGKVRDVHSIGEQVLVMVASNRISAFDVILPRTIPFKGQVLNQTAAYFCMPPPILFQTGYWMCLCPM